MHDFRLSSRQADNPLAGKSLLHMQTLGYHGKMCLKYVISVSTINMEKIIFPHDDQRSNIIKISSTEKMLAIDNFIQQQKHLCPQNTPILR